MQLRLYTQERLRLIVGGLGGGGTALRIAALFP